MPQCINHAVAVNARYCTPGFEYKAASEHSPAVFCLLCHPQAYIIAGLRATETSSWSPVLLHIDHTGRQRSQNPATGKTKMTAHMKHAQQYPLRGMHTCHKAL